MHYTTEPLSSEFFPTQNRCWLALHSALPQSGELVQEGGGRFAQWGIRTSGRGQRGKEERGKGEMGGKGAGKVGGIFIPQVQQPRHYSGNNALVVELEG